MFHNFHQFSMSYFDKTLAIVSLTSIFSGFESSWTDQSQLQIKLAQNLLCLDFLIIKMSIFKFSNNKNIYVFKLNEG